LHTETRNKIIIKIVYIRKDMHTDRCGNTRRQKCLAKGSKKEVKIHEFGCTLMYLDGRSTKHRVYFVFFIHHLHCDMFRPVLAAIFGQCYGNIKVKN
jgi:hypothetical protein